jgi:hypothetical protein
MHEVSDRTPGPPGEVLPFPGAGLAAALDAAQAGDRHREQLLRRWEGAPARRPREARRTGVHRPRWLGRFTRLVVCADLAAVATAVLLTGVRPDGPAGMLTLTAASGALVLVLALGGAYQHRFVGSGGEEFRRLAVAGTAAVALSGTAGYAAGPELQRLTVLGTPTARCGAAGGAGGSPSGCSCSASSVPSLSSCARRVATPPQACGSSARASGTAAATSSRVSPSWARPRPP